MSCPICSGKYSDIQNDDVCISHEDWIVTICKYCNRTELSNEPGVCQHCSRFSTTGFGGNKDRRAPLRSYGLE